jgi:GNAT superfamily N-acetyltransferase
MRVKSLGWRTDLALLKLEGSEIVEADGRVVVRSAENRGFRWGNFMLFAAPPRPGCAERWISEFNAVFPDADYVAIGIDRPSGELGASEEFSALGVRVVVHTVLTTSALSAPPREPPRATFRRVESDSDWRQATDLSLIDHECKESPSQHDYAERRMRVRRRVCEQGHGAWFGAFREDEMHAGLGIFGAGPGFASFQDVDTHPAHRRQGLSSHLVFTAGQYALTQLGASTLVIAADPDYHAIGIYRSLGFSDRERQVQLLRVHEQA